MKSLGIIKHIGIVVVSIVLLIVVPLATHFDVLGMSRGSDAVSGATIELPEQPSGDFVVLIKTSLHEKSIGDWRSFFNDDEFVVIFEDIGCLVAEGDVSAMQLAQRFQAQLPENQMRVKAINPTLLISKIESGYIDVAILSAEMAQALKLLPEDRLIGVTVVKISGGGN